MRVLAHGSFKSGGIICVMTAKTESIAVPYQVRLIPVAVHVVTVEAAQFAMVHRALHEVISLHAVLVRCQVWVLVEICDTGLKFLQAPIVGEALTGKKAHGPVVVSSVDWVSEWPSLRVALHADVVPANVVQSAGVYYV